MLHSYASTLLLCAFFASLFFIGLFALRFSFTDTKFSHLSDTLIAKFALLALASIVTITVIILVHAFPISDFSNEYVAKYSSLNLPTIYKFTALWAGQSGSMLFWLWSIVITGAFFVLLPTYNTLASTTRILFAVFFLGITAFTLLMLIMESPFATFPVNKIPADGKSMNPLLQHFGMILHPPLLFLGYGGFVVPMCLALAQACGQTHEDVASEPSWIALSRPISLIAWGLLTAGILLGSWWAYLELGWGGYWAWDPVENASIIPWFLATAYLHTSIIERRTGQLARVNIALVSLTTIAAFIATYITRSGILQSVHGFNGSVLEFILRCFIPILTLLTIYISIFTQRKGNALFENFFSKQGFISLLLWFLLALCCIITFATFYPAFQQGELATSLNANFYNKVCLPLFLCISLCTALFYFLPWRIGKSTSLTPSVLFGMLAGALATLFLFIVTNPIYQTGYSLGTLGQFIADFLHPLSLNPSPLIANLAHAIVDPQNTFSTLQSNHLFFAILQLGAVLVGGATLAALCIACVQQRLFTKLRTVLIWGIHVAFAIIVLGVAFSAGPNTIGKDFRLTMNKPLQIGPYIFQLQAIHPTKKYVHTVEELLANTEKKPLTAMALESPNNIVYEGSQAEIHIFDRTQQHIATLFPERRAYTTHQGMAFAEVSTQSTLTNEFYASFQGLTENNVAIVHISYHQFINWLWIGCILLALLPLSLSILHFFEKKNQPSKPLSNSHDY